MRWDMAAASPMSEKQLKYGITYQLRDGMAVSISSNQMTRPLRTGSTTNFGSAPHTNEITHHFRAGRDRNTIMVC
jgi:hypothetical protein